MDFDFNWILVPATLIFFVLWLLDKCVFKQVAAQKEKKQNVLHADQQITQAKQEFEQLKSKYPQMILSDAVSTPNEPGDVTQARDRLGQLQLNSVRAHTELAQHRINPVITWAYDFWPVLAVVLVVRSFFYEPFNIPSESMNPTLETGDFILVNKYAYGVRLPLLNTKILDTGEPQRGEVAVFRYPKQPSISYIKRIIGIPGDHVAFKQGELYINGQKQAYQIGSQVNLAINISKDQSVPVLASQWVVNLGEHRFISQYISTTQTDPLALRVVASIASNAANQPYSQLKVNGQFSPLSLAQNWEVNVPEGQYFVMGDNRDQSADSRFWGFVPEKNLTGRAMYIWMHKAPGLNVPTFKRNGRIS